MCLTQWRIFDFISYNFIDKEKRKAFVNLFIFIIIIVTLTEGYIMLSNLINIFV